MSGLRVQHPDVGTWESRFLYHPYLEQAVSMTAKIFGLGVGGGLMLYGGLGGGIDDLAPDDVGTESAACGDDGVFKMRIRGLAECKSRVRNRV